jgi:hypothetical protein
MFEFEQKKHCPALIFQMLSAAPSTKNGQKKTEFIKSPIEGVKVELDLKLK